MSVSDWIGAVVLHARRAAAEGGRNCSKHTPVQRLPSRRNNARVLHQLCSVPKVEGAPIHIRDGASSFRQDKVSCSVIPDIFLVRAAADFHVPTMIVRKPQVDVCITTSHHTIFHLTIETNGRS